MSDATPDETMTNEPEADAASEPAEKESHKPGGPTIVGIGTSAGGLAALKILLKEIDPESGMAFVIVVHLSPEQKSHLAEILQPFCSMPVLQVTETVELKPNHVFVIPPGANLNTIDTHLRLSKLEAQRRERAPIDHFFRTLATTHDGHAIGVILTGTGSDGTLGLRWIKEQGGVTIAQSPEEAEFDGMPRSAISSGFVDLVLPLAGIPDQLIRIGHTEPRVREHAEAAEDDNDRVIQRIIGQVQIQAGHDFSLYKKSTISRRIARRMQLHQLESLTDYLAYLRKHRDEVLRLFDDLLITVTEFFRDPKVFEYLEQKVVARLFENKGPKDRIRVWSVGCSTGEEAYSLAMLLLEEAAKLGPQRPQIQIFASDLHARSLKAAREGVYPDSLVTSVSPERLRRWFTKENGSYRIRPELREIVVFAPHDLLRDPPFSHQDLVVCRNVMIYLQRDLQDDVFGLFHYALNPKGLLLLGSAESINDSEGFIVEDKSHHLFRKRNIPLTAGAFPLQLGFVPRQHTEELRRDRPAVRPPDGYGALHARMAEQYAPPSVLINATHDIVHYSLHAGEFLQLRGGEPTNNIFKLVREPLRIELRAAIQAAHEQGKGIRTKPVPIEIDGRERQVIIRVRLAHETDLDGFALVIFDELYEPSNSDQHAGDPDSTNDELETELHLTRQRMQGVIEEYETTQEEMQATNEELQSANEELRSTLEELETSKEELQSMNEELATVNQENQHRVAELGQMTADLTNLLTATQIATVFLDRELRIVRFTPQIGELFNIRPSDRGRPLSDLTHNLGDASLHDDAQRVLERLVPIEREILAENRRWYFMRVMPYRTSDDRIDGVVITLIDISPLKKAESARDVSEGRYRSLFDSIDQGFCVVEMIYDEQGEPDDYRFLEINPAFESHTGLRDVVNRRMKEIAPDHEQEWYRIYGRVSRTGQPERFQHRAEALGRDFDVYAFRVGSSEQNRVAILFSDVTDRIAAEQRLIESRNELETRVHERTAQLEDRTHRLTELSRQLASAEHRERKRLAAMLHDELQQYLVALKSQLTVARDDGVLEKNEKRIQLCIDLTNEALKCSRDLTYRLRPPVLDEQGIVPAIRWLVEATSQWYGLRVEIDSDHHNPEISEQVHGVLFDSIRELLLNVVKHAGVDQASIRVRTQHARLLVEVADQGRGFDLKLHEREQAKSNKTYGLHSVREAIGSVDGNLSLESGPGKGARIRIEVPCSDPPADSDAQA